MTPQEIFDTAYQGLMAQGRQSTREIGGAHVYRCAYRGDNGAKCAVGFLVDDDLAVHMDEIGSISDILEVDWDDTGGWKYPEVAEDIPDWLTARERLLQALQDAHDHDDMQGLTGDRFRKELTEQFATIADKFGLEMKDPTND